MAYKTFSNGDVLNASEINDNLMNQSVIVFNNEAARSAAFPFPVTGMVTFILDRQRYEMWTGLAWNLLSLQTDSVGLGVSALASLTTGSDAVAVGVGALANNNSTSCVGIGRSALTLTTAANNVAVGRSAGLNTTTGNGNTYLGHQAGSALQTGNNNTIIGQNAAALATSTSNSITLGNSSITSLRCQVTTISSLSDERDKTDITDTQFGMNLIEQLRPVDFTWARRDGSYEGITDVGFISQELIAVEDSFDAADRLRLTLRDNPESLEATPGRLIPVIVKALQELSAENASLKARLEALEK